VGVGGEDYAIIAASTRMSTSFSILTRHSSKFTQMCASEPGSMPRPCCIPVVTWHVFPAGCAAFRSASHLVDSVSAVFIALWARLHHERPAQSTRGHHRHGGHAGGHADAAQDAAGAPANRKLPPDVFSWCLMMSDLTAPLRSSVRVCC